MLFLKLAESSCYLSFPGRRTQVVKGEVCKTSMQRFESARRLQIILDIVRDSESASPSHYKTALIASFNSGETVAP